MAASARGDRARGDGCGVANHVHQPARCGVGLFAYLFAAVMVIVAGVWSSIWTWRHRTAQGHVLALLLIVWGVVLGATEVLPRVGYAKPNPGQTTTWMCQ